MTLTHDPSSIGHSRLIQFNLRIRQVIGLFYSEKLTWILASDTNLDIHPTGVSCPRSLNRRNQFLWILRRRLCGIFELYVCTAQPTYMHASVPIPVSSFIFN